jgi:hypothetical protein
MLRHSVQMPQPEPGVEIYGLNMKTNGRQCTNHTCCGEVITHSALLKLKSCVVKIKDEERDAVCAISLNEGSYGCVVGFLPSFLLPNAQDYVGKVLQVTLLYDADFNKSRCEYSKRNGGVAHC